MKKNALLLVIVALFLGNISNLHAQILNGSFASGDFTDWNTLGLPEVITNGGPTPPSGTTQALVQSTNGDTGATSASAATIDAALGLTLPSTSGAGTAYPGDHLAINGQAIYQTFTVSGEATLSFAYSFQSYDSIPFDSVGYVLDGVYTQLASPTETFSETPDPNPTAYTTLSLVLNASPEPHTFGFVAYNTGDNTLSSSLYVTNILTIVATPEPSASMLIVLGCVSLIIVRKLRSRLSAI